MVKRILLALTLVLSSCNSRVLTELTVYPYKIATAEGYSGENSDYVSLYTSQGDEIFLGESDENSAEVYVEIIEPYMGRQVCIVVESTD